MDLPELYSAHTENGKKRKPLIMDFADTLKEGGKIDIGTSQLKLDKKKAEIISKVGTAMFEMVVNRHLEARAKAHVPLMGGHIEFEANRDPEGKHRFGVQSNTPAFGGNLNFTANRDADGNRQVGLQFRKNF